MSSDISIDSAMDSASAVEDCTNTAAATIDTPSANQMAAAQSEDTNDIPSTSVEITTAISTTTDKAISTPPISKPSSSINKLQNVKWRREWRGIHLPPSAGILNSKFYDKNDIIDEIEHIEESSEIDNDLEEVPIEVPIEVLPVEVPIVEEEPIEDIPQQQQTSILYNQPSIPLYPLLITIILYQLFKYIFRKLFTYKKRSRFMRSMKCRINSLGGNYEQFAISQSELEGHIEKLKSRNEKKRNKESDDKKKKKGKKKSGGKDKSDRGGKRDDDTDGDRGMADETDENRGGNSSNGGSGNTADTNNKSSGQQSGNKNGNSYSSTKHSTNHNEQAKIQEYKVKVQQLTQQNEVLLLKVNQLEVENEQLDNEMEHMMDEMCNIDENEDKDSLDGKEIDISGSYSDTIVESLTDDEGDEDTLLQELEDAKVDISTLTKEHQVAKEEVLRLSMEVAKLTSDKEDLEQRLKDEEGKGYQSSSSYDALLVERDELNDTILDINKSIQDAHDIVAELTGDGMEQDIANLEEEDTKTTHEKARHSASRLLSQLSHIKTNGGLVPPPSPPASPTDQASFDRLEMGGKSRKKIEKSVISSTVSSPAAGDLLCLIDSSSPQRQVDPTRRELFPSQEQVKEVVLLPRVLPPPQPVVKDCTIMAVDSQHTQDSTKGSSSSSSSGEESSARDGEWPSTADNSDNVIGDSLDQQSISYGMNETYCSDDEYDAYDNDLIVGFKGSILNLSKAASRDVDAIQRSRGLSKLVRMWSKRSERSKW